jgi:hypothetical protein
MNLQDMDYGYYLIGRGCHKGKIAYFDDEMTDKSGYFYLGAFRDGFIVIPFSFIERAATEKEIAEHTITRIVPGEGGARIVSSKSVAQY